MITLARSAVVDSKPDEFSYAARRITANRKPHFVDVETPGQIPSCKIQEER
ncbi:hypothetical protein [Mycobacterium vicinigordonae]|uniref:Uncharacterized protein n=1 Tax=Mycobacterium vicinigordonae TaxID=1719132 RepID=A0A7D6DXI3_9MYCO|nr:hypothetical protein [Mycobacterium vicinigordonae]QLL06150.1 hypothetical protein H0P51_20590 [Mycobacterium vicinigordonae]